MNIQSWSELSAPLVNMSKDGYGNKSALFILLILHSNNSQNKKI